MDGEGDFLSSTVNIYENKNLKKISENSNDVSLGYLYAEVTKYLGLKPFEHEFKVMGMSPYGSDKDAERILSSLKNLVYLNQEGKFNSKVVSSLYKYEIENIFKFEKFENICKAVQLFTEKIVLDWIKFWIKKTSIKIIIVSGGVFMNIKACKEISMMTEVDELSVVPSASDESLPFGALFKMNNLKNQNIKIIKNLYLGNSYEQNIDSFIKKIENENFKIYNFKSYENLNEEVSNLLSKNEIVARLFYKEEWGARALGNRSILCNPSKIENIKIINEAIKHRDYWMPFSPSILEEDHKNYFYNPKNIDTKFMTCLFDSTELARDHLKAAIHPIDFTLRPQIVSKSLNPEYHDLILKFKNKTSIGGLLNTSFNLHGEPNVSDYNDAFFTFKNSKLNYLILENYLIKKIH